MSDDSPDMRYILRSRRAPAAVTDCGAGLRWCGSSRLRPAHAALAAELRGMGQRPTRPSPIPGPGRAGSGEAAPAGAVAGRWVGGLGLQGTAGRGPAPPTRDGGKPCSAQPQL